MGMTTIRYAREVQPFTDESTFIFTRKEAFGSKEKITNYVLHGDAERCKPVIKLLEKLNKQYYGDELSRAFWNELICNGCIVIKSEETIC
jgi:hypothetical protein